MTSARWHRLGCAVWLWLGCAATVALANPADEKFLAGLRQRRLFGLVETYCAERLKSSDLPAADRALLATELSRSYAERAVNSAPAAAEELWQRAVAVASDRAASPARQSHLARLALDRGEWERQLAEASGSPPAAIEKARGRLHEAIKLLETAASGAAKAPSPAEVHNELSRELARAYRNLAQLQPTDGPDRANALSRAIESLAPLVRLPAGDPVSWPARLDEAQCFRLLKDYPAANVRLGQLLAQPLPPELLARARAEQVQLATGMGRLDAALAVLDAAENTPVASAELDLAAVAALSAARGEALAGKQVAEANQYERRAADLVRTIRSRHGAHVARRAEALLAVAPASGTPASDLDQLIREAENFYRTRKLDAAVETYDRAKALATARGNSQQAFQFGYTAASIEHERQRHRAATDRYRQLAMSQPNHERAGDAHLLAIFNAAQEARRHEPVKLDEYASLLEEHLKAWPAGKGADQAHWLQGKLKEHAGQWDEAAAAYLQVSPDHAQYAAAVEAGAACQRKVIEAAREAGRPAGPLVSAAATRFEAVFLSTGNRLPEKWSPVQRTAAANAARLWLNAEPPDYERAERILRSALADANDAPAAWQSGAQGLLACALAGQGRLAEARTMMEQLSSGSPAETLLLLESLNKLAADSKGGASQELAGLQLQAVELLASQRDKLEPAAQTRYARLEAQALAAGGRREQALASYAALAKGAPQDGDVQEEYAALLSQATDKPSLDAALVKWRELEQKSRAGTPRWFRAKYQLAALHERQGNKQQAAKIASLTQVLHPDLGGPELKAKFEQLLARCKKQ